MQANEHATAPKRIDNMIGLRSAFHGSAPTPGHGSQLASHAWSQVESRHCGSLQGTSFPPRHAGQCRRARTSASSARALCKSSSAWLAILLSPSTAAPSSSSSGLNRKQAPAGIRGKPAGSSPSGVQANRRSRSALTWTSRAASRARRPLLACIGRPARFPSNAPGAG